MINIEFLDISGDQVPVNKFYELDGTTYTFRLKYNDIGEFFTLEVYDTLNQTFLFSNKMVYGTNMIDSLNAPFPDKIIPLSINILKGDQGTENITEESLGNSIKLLTNIEET